MCKETANSHQPISSHTHSNGPSHDHDHGHTHTDEQPSTRLIHLKQSVLLKNEEIAERNRRWFREHNIRVLNLISSPGSGKTLLLEKSVEALNSKIKMAIIAGDQEQDFDTQRLRARGAVVMQLNTHNLCHLDAHMLEHELNHFIQPDLQLLVVENVGNLVCPAAFDLGENEKVALLSVTEGEDKPSKYPLVFHEASAIVITKTDLRPHLDWNQALCERHIRKVNRVAPIFYVSAKSGQGMSEWLEYVQR